MKELVLFATTCLGLLGATPTLVSAKAEGAQLAMARPSNEPRTPKSKDWAAWESRMPQIGDSGPRLYVTGKVEVPGTQYRPVLTPSEPQGINPKILLLDLSIEGLGEAEGGKAWRDVRFEAPVMAGQYVQVSILFQGAMIDNLDVTIAH